MVESTPSQPYGGMIEDMLKVEANMQLRRQQTAAVLAPGEIFLTLTAFPRSGMPLRPRSRLRSPTYRLLLSLPFNPVGTPFH